MPEELFLNEQDRSKLDSIVQEMQSNGETIAYIQSVVDDFKGKYGKKKELSDSPSLESPSGSLSAGENLLNNINNVWYQIQGIPQRTALSIVTAAEKTFGEEVGEFVTDGIFSMSPIGAGLAAVDDTKELLQSEAMKDLKELEGKMAETNPLTEGESWDSVGKAASNIAGAVMQIIPTAAAGAALPGVGIFTDMVGYGLYDYNTELANRKGKTIEQLYADGEDEFLAPAVIGTTAGYLERKGFKGATKAFTKAMSKSGTKEILKSMAESGFQEGYTEWLQSGMEEANRAIARGEENISGIQADFMFSKQGLENLLVGAISGGVLGGGGAVRRRSVIGDTETAEQKNKVKQEIIELDDAAKDKSLDDEERAEYKKLRDEKVEEFKEVQKKETEFYDKFTDEDYDEVKGLDREIVSVLDKIEKFKSEKGKPALEKKVEQLVERKKQVEQKYRVEETKKTATEEAPVAPATPEAKAPEAPAVKKEQVKQPVAEQKKAPVQTKTTAEPVAEEVVTEEQRKEDLAAQKAQAIKQGLGPTVQNLRTAIQTLEAQKAKVAEEGNDVTEYDTQIKEIQGMVDRIEQSSQPVSTTQPAAPVKNKKAPRKKATQKSAAKVEAPKKSFTIESANIVTESSPAATKDAANKKFTQEFKKSLANATSMTEFIGTYGQQGDRFTIDKATYVVQSVEEDKNKKRVSFSLVDSKGNRKRNYTATIENGKPVTIRNAKGLIDVFAKRKKATYDRFKDVADAKKVEVEVKKTKGKKEQRIFKPKTKKGIRYAMAKAFGLNDAQSEAATEIIYRGMKNLALRKGIEISDVMKGIRYVRGTERDADRIRKQIEHASLKSSSIHNESMTLAQLNPIQNKILDKHTKEGIDDPIVVEGINILNKLTGKNILRRPEGESFEERVQYDLEGIENELRDMAESKIISSDIRDVVSNRALDALLRLDAAAIIGIKTDFNSPLSEQVTNEQVEQAKGVSFEDALVNTARNIRLEQMAAIDKWIALLTTIRNQETYWDGADWIKKPKINAQEKLRALVLFDKLLVSKYDLATDKDYKRNNKSTDQFPFLIERVALDWIKSGKSDEHPLKSYTKMVGEAKGDILKQEDRVIYKKNGVKVYKFRGADPNDPSFGAGFEFKEEIEALTIMTQDTVFCTKTMASSQLNRGDFYLMLDGNDKVTTAINLDNSTRTIVEIKGNTNNQQRILEFRDQEHDFIANSGEIKNGERFVERELSKATDEFEMPQSIETVEDAENVIKDFLFKADPDQGDSFIKEFDEKGGWDLLGVTPEQVMLVSWSDDNFDHNKYLNEIGNLDQFYDEDKDQLYYFPSKEIKIILNLDVDGPLPTVVYNDLDVNLDKIYIRETDTITIELPTEDKYDVNIGDVVETSNKENLDADEDLTGTSMLRIIPNGSEKDWDNLVTSTQININGKVESSLNVRTGTGVFEVNVNEGGSVNLLTTTKSFYSRETPASILLEYGDVLNDKLSTSFRDLKPGESIGFKDFWGIDPLIDTNQILFQVSEISREIKDFKSKDKKEADGKARELRKKYKLMNLKVYKYGGEYKIKAIRDEKSQKKSIKGAMAIEDSVFMIYALTNPDISTPLHEFSHVYERYLTPEEIKIVEKWSGYKKGTVDFSESFARGFERYLADGKAPVPALQKIFDNLRKWLKKIYEGIRFKSIEKDLTPEVREIFDNMILTPAEKAQMQQNAANMAAEEAAQAEEVAKKTTKKVEPKTTVKPTPKKEKKTKEPLDLPNGKLDLGDGNYIEYKGLVDGKHMYSFYDAMFGDTATIDADAARAMLNMDSGPLFQEDIDEDFESMPDLADKMVNESEKEVLMAEAASKGRILERLTTEWSDRQGNIRKQLEKLGLTAVESLMTNRAGSKARGVNRFHKFEAEIYDGITKPVEKLMNKILQFERIVQIETNRRARRKVAQAQLDKLAENKKSLKEGLMLNLSKEERKEIETLLKKIENQEQQLKKRIEDNGVMKHPEGITEDYAVWWLENKATRYSYYQDAKDRADKYFSAMNDLLEDAYNAELIDDQTFERFKSDKYITRIFLDKIFGIEVDQNGEMIAVGYQENEIYKETGMSVEQIKTLRGGSEGPLVTDSRYILEKMAVSISNRSATNKMNKALGEAMVEQTAVPWYRPAKYKKDKEGNVVVDKFGNNIVLSADVREGFENVFYRENGKLRAFQMKSELAKEWNDSVRSVSEDSLIEEGLKMAGGVSILKAGATGYNPMFFISNVPMDIANVLFFTDIYDDSILPVSFFKVSRNVTQMSAGLVEADAGIKSKRSEEATQLLEEYIENGGMMEFFYTYGQQGIKGMAMRLEEEGKLGLSNTTKKVLKKAGHALQYTGEKTELGMRLASFKQVKEKLTRERKQGKNEYTDDQIKAIAVAKARKTMDFNQGGVSAKKLDRWVPYLNAAIQGFRISREYIAKNPGKFMEKMGQVSLAVMGLVMYNLSIGDDEDDYDNIPDYIKDNYFVILLPFKDENGHRKYLRIRKTQSMVPFLTVAEMAGRALYYGAKGEKDPLATEDKIKRTWDSVQDALPLALNIKDNLTKLPPTVVGAYKYYTNYDLFRRMMVSPANEFGKISPSEEGRYDERVPLFYKAIGQGLNASPRRMQAAVETITTSPRTNGVVAVAYSIGDFVTNMLYQPGKEEKSIYNGNVLEALTGIGKSSLERVIGTSYPRSKKEIKSGVKEIEMLEGDVRYRIKKVTDMHAKDKDLKGMKEFLSGIENPADRKYAIDRYNKISTTDLSKIKDAEEILDVMYARDPEAAAKIYVYYFGKPDFSSVEAARKTSEQLKYMKETLGFRASKRFLEELKRQAKK